jgi:putative DNA primase/helicase
MPYHRAVLLFGHGRNGKGTFLRLIEKLIGPRFVSAVTLQSLGEGRFASADLFGKIANISGDLDARYIKRADVFKMAT